MSSESTETFRVAPVRMADSENCMLVSEIGQDQRQKDSGRHRAGVWGTWWKVGVAGQVFRVGAPCHPFGRRTPNHTFLEEPKVKLNGLEAGKIYFFQAEQRCVRFSTGTGSAVGAVQL